MGRPPDSKSVIQGQQQRGHASVRLGDDPKRLPAFQGVSGHQTAPLAQCPRIFLAVGFAEVTPVAARVAGNERFKALSGFVQGLQGTGSGDELA